MNARQKSYWWLVIPGAPALAVITFLALSVIDPPTALLPPGTGGTGIDEAAFNAASELERLLADAEAKLEQKDYPAVEDLAQQVLQEDSSNGRAHLLAGLAAAQREAYDDALTHYGAIPTDQVELAVMGYGFAGELLWSKMDQLQYAEAFFRRALEIDSTDPHANHGLAYVLGICGRRWESGPYLLELIRTGRWSQEHLLWLGVLDSVIDSQGKLEACASAAPDDPLPSLGLARLALRDNEPQKAIELLQPVVARFPLLNEAQARLGHAYYELGESGEFLQWDAALPSVAGGHPEVWLTRGLWARRQGEADVAVRCFSEAVLLDPTHHQANYQLGLALAALQRPEYSDVFVQRADQLKRVMQHLQYLQAHPLHLDSIEQATELFWDLGRYWECLAWSLMARQIDEDAAWPQARIDELQELLFPDTPFVHESFDTLAGLDPQEFPLPSWRLDSADTPADVVQTQPAQQIQFVDVAGEVGLDFRYEPGAPAASGAPRMHQVNGGGVGVIDVDGDWWPDLCFTQGGQWPAEQQDVVLDRVFRNLDGERFQDITAMSGIDNPDYSFGLTVGDYNNDGFSDLFVCNVQANRLYRNNGDGTFTDVTRESGIRGDQWSTSAVWADMNGDGLPDLYVVNYLEGEDLFERICIAEREWARVCSPHEFPSAQDQFFVNTGDGQFHDATKDSGLVAANGKGLGVIAADFAHRGKLDLFVANDGVANFFFRNDTPTRQPTPSFQEQALASGLAYDEAGLVQACMGVAADDADGNGRLDLFVTNFFAESNVLYAQQDGSLFVDATRPAGLRDASFRLLGFGTQFLDADLDGWSDLVLTNGHLDDRTDLGEPYRMRPQFFRNRGDLQFDEVSSDAAGSYFQKEYLGRGLAKTDWNRDGRVEFAVTDLKAAATLTSNRTTSHGHYLAISLRGVKSPRDAIGTRVQVKHGASTWTKQLTAGDGYQCSNERLLVFGLGDRSAVNESPVTESPVTESPVNESPVTELVVTWPSGEVSRWENVEVDTHYLAIEGQDRLVTVIQ